MESNAYKEIKHKLDSLGGELNNRYIEDFNNYINQIRELMKRIGMKSISIECTLPLFNGHGKNRDNGNYIIQITSNGIMAPSSINGVEATTVNHTLLKSLNWFNVYVYIVGMELELTRINEHLTNIEILLDE